MSYLCGACVGDFNGINFAGIFFSDCFEKFHSFENPQTVANLEMVKTIRNAENMLNLEIPDKI